MLSVSQRLIAEWSVKIKPQNRRRETMLTITITLPDDRLQKLQEIAAHFQVAPEELVRVSIEELLTRPQEDFQRALEYVLRKNAELYQRLA
jgi:predicted transcriptional regulator